MKKRFGVIGLGNFGYHVVRTLFAEGHEVVAMDLDKEKVQAIRDHCTYAVLGDAAHKEFLENQGVHELDAVVVSTGERSHLSSLITLYLKELHVPRILVKAVNEDHGRILEKVGATEVIFPEKNMAEKVAHNLSQPNVLEYIPLAEGYSLSEMVPPQSFLGKTLTELDLRRKHQVTVIAIKDILTDKFITVPPPNYLLKDSDVMILIGKTDDLEKSLEDS